MSSANLESIFTELRGVRHDLARLAEHDHLLKNAVRSCDELLIDLETILEYRKEKD